MAGSRQPSARATRLRARRACAADAGCECRLYNRHKSRQHHRRAGSRVKCYRKRPEPTSRRDGRCQRGSGYSRFGLVACGGGLSQTQQEKERRGEFVQARGNVSPWRAALRAAALMSGRRNHKHRLSAAVLVIFPTTHQCCRRPQAADPPNSDGALLPFSLSPVAFETSRRRQTEGNGKPNPVLAVSPPQWLQPRHSSRPIP